MALPGGQTGLAAITSQGDLVVYSLSGTTWNKLDVTTLTQSAKISGSLAISANASTLYIAALTTGNNAILYSTPQINFPGGAYSHTAVSGGQAWTVTLPSSTTTTAPALSGAIFLNATSTQVSISGQAANWGDLFTFTNNIGLPSWSAVDVSTTGGTQARTVGSVVTGTQVGNSFTLYAAGVDSPPPQGVGVYAIPSAKWSNAINDGWPIISETGGLGTQSAPWVGFTSAKTVATSPDFLLGQTIYNSHKRVTWLSFWTASGAVTGEPRTATTYYSHGFAAGAWVATQIDQYRSLGVGLTPDWVIFDPEGYPDNHSGLDAPGGSSNATIATYATYWSAMLSGWTKGLASVDPSLNAGVYASQSEYRNYGLSTQPLPVFMAVAFGGGGPLPVAGATGSNVRGYIAFSAVCAPSATLLSEEQTLKNPPWSGQFNTLQFNAGVYCPPA